jgi:PAS domain S-box-containing protein
MRRWSARRVEEAPAETPDVEENATDPGVGGVLLARLPLATYVFGIDGATLYLSSHLEKLLGCRPEDWQHDPAFFLRLIHPDDRERVVAELAAHREDDHPFRLEYQVRRAGGEYVCVQDESVFARDGSGTLIAREGYLLDVTDRVRALEAVQGVEARLRSLLSNVPGAIYRCALDADWNMEFISDNVEWLCGYPASDFMTAIRTFASVIHPDDRDVVERIVVDAVERHEPFDVEYRIMRADGRERWVHEKGQGVRGERGEVLWLDGAIFDVTDRKAAELALLTEREQAAAGLREVSDQAARQARQMADEALASLAVAREGHDVVDAIAGSMAEIKVTTEAISSGIMVLTEQVGEIERITEMVADLPDQSNLRALTAAIEAAKAGDQGRGFAVVAGEVRRLAEQSKQATAQVRSLLGVIETATGSAVDATEQGTQVVGAGIDLTARARHVIGELARTIEAASGSAARIASSAHEQSIEHG